MNLTEETANIQIKKLGTCHDDTVFEENSYLVALDSRLPLSFGAYSYSHSGIFHAVTKVGRYCSIAYGVFFGHHEHPTNWLTTSSIATDNVPAIFADAKVDVKPFRAFKPIEIGNDVWIGTHSYIRSGVTIGDGAIVGAHAIVTRDVPPYAVVVGNPARVVKYRFPEELINDLLEFRWWRFNFADFPKLDVTNTECALRQLKKMAEDGDISPYFPKSFNPKNVTMRGGSVRGW